MAKILVVDDEEEMHRLMNAILASKHEPLFLDSADRAASMLRAGHTRFDLVITDIRMPGLSGMDFAHWVRRFYPELPILVVSGLIVAESDPVATRLRRIGVQAILGKPFTALELLDAIDDAIEDRS